MQSQDSHAVQLKRIAPFLDSHVLLQFLRTNVPQSEKLQQQLSSQLLLSQKEKAKEIEEQAKQDASKLLTLINNQEQKQLREARQFTLEKLQEDRGITLQDCRKLFDYAKLQYEMGEYKTAEKYLFPLKEILTLEHQAHTDLVLQIFWGLLSCEILLQRERNTVERTTQRKLKELIDKMLTDNAHTQMESMNQKAWFLNQILVYSFNNRCTDLFQNMLADRTFYGNSYLNVVQVKCQYLIRYQIVSLFINRITDEFIDVVLPIIIAEKDSYSDSFTRFIEALYEDFDFEKAQSLVKDMVAEAQGDLILKNYSNEIQFQATLLISEVKCQVYKTVDLTNLAEESGRDYNATCQRLEENMQFEGFQVDLNRDQKVLTIIGQEADLKTRLITQTEDLVKRTVELNQHYHNQINYLKTYGNGLNPQIDGGKH
eukprot:403338592